MFRTALISLVLASSASVALAQDDYETTPSVRVAYTETDLSSPDSAAKLVSRLEVATRKACGADNLERRDLQQLRIFDECRKESMGRAITAINSPLVYAAAHVEHNSQLVQR